MNKYLFINKLIDTMIQKIIYFFWACYHFSAIFFITFLATLIIAHLISWLTRKPSLKLNQDSTILIIGACTGIGRIMAVQAAKKYHSRIIIVDFQTHLFEFVSKQITNECSVCQCIQCDLTSPQSVQNLIKQLNEKGTKIDLLIYNAGIMIPKLCWELTSEDREKLMRVNYFAPIQIINGLLNLLKHGHISVVASLVSIIDGGRQLSIYVASKHAIYAYLCALRQEFNKQDIPITVSIGCPYAINTGMFDGFSTKFEFLFPMMDQNKTAKRLLKQFVQRKQVCFVYQYEAVFLRITSLFPTFIFDLLATKLDRSDFSKLKEKLNKENAQKKIKKE